MLQLCVEHVHPVTDNCLVGLRLHPGANLRENDYYASTSGEWERNPCGTIELGTSEVLWVRPERDLSPNVSLVLATLSYSYRRCRMHFGNSYFYIHPNVQPFPIEGGYNTAVELIDYGFLHYDPSEETYRLTDLGIEAQKKLIQHN
ncbi:MAG TPA: hypothetical protein VLG69_00460 [Candidatus Andersenbacteria bacterium]|nr:hypothetical protein [Candidatus Andersenbacteria bacterium]